MAGAYCNYCDRRCFVYRIVPDGPSKGWGGHMATCTDGMVHDLKALGHTYRTAVNPITEPEAAELIAAEVFGARGRKAAALAVDAGQFTEFAAQVSEMFPDPAQAPGVGQMTDADWLAVAYELHSPARGRTLVRDYWDKADRRLDA